MAFTIRKKTKSGTYVYSVESYWDKEKGQPRQRSVYLGKEEADGTIKSVRKSSAVQNPSIVKEFGAVAAARHIAEDQGIVAALRGAFGEEAAETIFLLSVFLIAEELPLYLFETWAAGVSHRFTGNVNEWQSPKLSKLLQFLGSSCGQRHAYQSTMMEQHNRTTLKVLIDGTSISTYSDLDGWAAWGHNRDGEKLPQSNIQLAVIEPAGLPVSLRMVEGSVPDISTLVNTAKEMEALGVRTPVIILDRGYFSSANLDLLAKSGCKVIIPVPGNKALFKDAKRLYGKRIRMAENAFTVNGDTMYGISFDTVIDERKYQAFLYFNASRKANEEHRFYRSIEKVERLFADEKPLYRKKAVALLNENLPRSKASLMKLEYGKEGVWTIARKPKAIARHLNGLGFMLLLSDAGHALPAEALSDYRSRDAVEKLIDNLKNALNDDRLRIHSAQAAEGKLFLMLVAMTLHAIMQQLLAPSAKTLGRRISPREAMLALRRIKVVPCDNDTILISEVAKRERQIIELLKVPSSVFASTSS